MISSAVSHCFKEKNDTKQPTKMLIEDKKTSEPTTDTKRDAAHNPDPTPDYAAPSVNPNRKAPA